jgi:uncharacterized lipoprotein YehR (DUF1307 family)
MTLTVRNHYQVRVIFRKTVQDFYVWACDIEEAEEKIRRSKKINVGATIDVLFLFSEKTLAAAFNRGPRIIGNDKKTIDELNSRYQVADYEVTKPNLTYAYNNIANIKQICEKVISYLESPKTKEEAQLQMKITSSMLKIIDYCGEIK